MKGKATPQVKGFLSLHTSNQSVLNGHPSQVRGNPSIGWVCLPDKLSGLAIVAVGWRRQLKNQVGWGGGHFSSRLKALASVPNMHTTTIKKKKMLNSIVTNNQKDSPPPKKRTFS